MPYAVERQCRSDEPLGGDDLGHVQGTGHRRSLVLLAKQNIMIRN